MHLVFFFNNCSYPASLISIVSKPSTFHANPITIYIIKSKRRDIPLKENLHREVSPLLNIIFPIKRSWPRFKRSGTSSDGIEILLISLFSSHSTNFVSPLGLIVVNSLKANRRVQRIPRS